MRAVFNYKELLQTDEWIRKRNEIMERDSHRCRNCQSTAQLEVHHRQYHVHPVTGQPRNPWEYDPVYLITLCRGCHAAGHEKYQIPVFNN